VCLSLLKMEHDPYNPRYPVSVRKNTDDFRMGRRQSFIDISYPIE